MKHAVLTLFSLAAVAFAAQRPNVVIIYGDDVGYGDVGAYGCKDIPTPNIDKLAAGGLLFTDGHCGASTCTPSRFSMLTGSAAFRFSGTGILTGNAAMAIRPDMFTLPDLFKQAGYTTCAIGKWHLGLGDGKTPIDWNGAIKPGPLEIGFDTCHILPATNDRVPCVYLHDHHIVNLDPADPITVSYGKKINSIYPDAKENPEAMTYYKSTHGHDNSVINGIGRIGWMTGGKSALWNDEEITDALVGQTRSFIKANKDKPFFIYFASQCIHVPRTPNKRFQGATKLGYRGDSMVEFDWATGEILKALEDNGLAGNTIVIFSSDNGPVYDDGYDDGTTVRTSSEEVDHGHDGSGALRGGKYQIYEGGTRVPFIVSWPGTIPPGKSDALVSQLDFMASFAKLLGQSLPEGSALDSQDMLAALTGKTAKGNELILEQTNNKSSIALRKGPWKYIPERTGKNKKGKAQPAELYNLDKDIGEQNNVIKQHPEVAADMGTLLDTYSEQGLRRQ